MPMANSVITIKHSRSLHFIFGLHVHLILLLNQRSWVSHHSLSAVLDPRISYKANEFKNDSGLAVYLETAKADLREYFTGNYPSLQASVENPHQSLSVTTSLSSITLSPSLGSP